VQRKRQFRWDLPFKRTPYQVIDARSARPGQR
jgi:hypothetical protein